MVQKRAHPKNQQLGPWLGLHTTADASQLPLGFATIARNVVLSDGRIRPRHPWRVLRKNRVVTNKEDLQKLNEPVQNAFHWEYSFQGPRLIVKSLNGLWDFPDGGEVRQLCTLEPSFNPGQFLLHGATLYFMYGAERLWRTDTNPNNTIKVGIVAPLLSQFNDILVTAALPIHMAGRYQYAISRWDKKNDVESNAVFFPDEITVADQEMVRFSSSQAGGVDFEGASHWRLYRRGLGQNQTAYRLVSTPLIESGYHQWFDSDAEDAITISSDVTGPFAPTRNGVPKFATCGWVHDDRLFFNNVENPGLLYFSAIGIPDQAHPDDYFNMRGDGDDRITGVIAVGDQVFVGKPRGIRAVSGTVATATNATNATGALPLEGTARVVRTTANVGPSTFGGNGFILAGTSSLIHYANTSGFYAFDGVTERLLSGSIRPTWQDFVGRRTLESVDATLYLTMANDTRHELLYLCQNPRSVPRPEDAEGPPILVYHYGVAGDGSGAWTTFDGRGTPPPLIRGVVTTPTCVWQPAGLTHSHTEFSPLAVGTLEGYVLQADSTAFRTDNRDPMPAVMIPDVEWMSGDLSLVRGMKAHVFWIKFFLANATPPPYGSPAVDVQLLIDRPAEGVPHAVRSSASVITKRILLTGEDYQAVAVRRHASTMTIHITRAPNWTSGWNTTLGILGFEMDMELVGQR